MVSRSRHRLLVIAGVALVAACRPAASQAPRFDTAPVERGPLISRVTASGTLSALVTVQVGSQVSGRIQKILVDFNSVVHKGDLLAEIDPQLFEASVEQSRANLASNKAQLLKASVMVEKTKRDLARQRKLEALKLIAAADLDASQAAYDGAVADVENARASVLQAEAQLHQAGVNLKYTTIYSPIDGVVISRAIDVGQTVAASFSSPTLFTIAEDLRKMQVDTSVSEADIGKLSADQRATFTVDAFPGDHFEGKVRQIRNAATTVQNVVTYDVVIDVLNPELKLRPGMTANVDVIADQRSSALKVSNAAFRFRMPAELMPAAPVKTDGDTKLARVDGDHRRDPKGGEHKPNQKSLWVLENGQPKMLSVKTGITDGKFTEVLAEELHEGDLVVTAYNSPDKKPGTQGMMRRPF
jgi:HlyD family secretion protein